MKQDQNREPMGFSSRNAAIAVLVLGIVISSIRKYAQAPLPVTKVDMTDKVIIVTGEHVTPTWTDIPVHGRQLPSSLHELPVLLVLYMVLASRALSGASAGIGKETARILADWGGKVIMACRDEKKAGLVLQDIKATTGSNKVHIQNQHYQCVKIIDAKGRGVRKKSARPEEWDRTGKGMLLRLTF